MKAMLLHPLRLALLGLPAYNLYVFSQGKAEASDLGWWVEQAGFIAWALGAYIILLLSTFIFRLNWMQLIFFCAGAAGLGYFYLTEEIYSFFLAMEYFQGENKKMLPVIPYAMTFITLIVAWVFKTRHHPVKTRP